MAKEIRQRVILNATPNAVFDALMDAKKHAAFTGARAKVDRKVGGRATAYDGSLEAINVELSRGKRIVQAWRSTDWPDGLWSIATFALTAAAGGKTALTFTQDGVPASDVDDIALGWKTYYWTPMNEWFAK